MKPTKTLRKQLFQLTGPIFVETLLIMLLGAMDTFMLSHYSDDTVAAVGVVNQLLNLVFLVFGVSTVGTSVLCSQYLGASQQANVRQVVGVSLVFNTLIGVTTSAFLYFRAEALKDVDIDDDAFKGVEAIIYSMTPEERENPELINGSRRKRIASGSGTTIQDVNRLLKQFDESKKMMRMLSKGGKMMGKAPMKRR